MPFPISDWFTAGHMTYHNSTIQPQKAISQAILNVLSIAMLPVIKAANVVNDHGPTGLLYKVT